MRDVLVGKLWIGNAGDARDIRRVLSAGVTAVIDLAMEEPPAVYPREIICCRFPLLDGPDNPSPRLRLAIATAAELIRSRIPTLIACSGGMSRAPSIAAAALAFVRGVDPQHALAEVLGTGPRDLAPGLWADVEAVLSQLRS